MLPQDKANHFIYGLLITAIFLFLCPNIPLAIFSCGVIAISKEIYDIKSSKFSWLDTLATIAGGLTTVLIYLIR